MPPPIPTQVPSHAELQQRYSDLSPQERGLGLGLGLGIGLGLGLGLGRRARVGRRRRDARGHARRVAELGELGLRRQHLVRVRVKG